jgi:myb proto-oncogene protein
MNKLDPNLCKKKWNDDDGKKLFKLHKNLGAKWKVIIKEFPGRTDNFLKNQFFSLIRRALRRIVKYLKTPKGEPYRFRLITI